MLNEVGKETKTGIGAPVPVNGTKAGSLGSTGNDPTEYQVVKVTTRMALTGIDIDIGTGTNQ